MHLQHQLALHLKSSSLHPALTCVLLPYRFFSPAADAALSLLFACCCCCQMESTLAMQAVAPRVKELQAKYANDPETLQLETARMYKSAGINPLAGCLPTLATIPVFIGLYRCGC
jgi:hypothetical protein